MNKENKEITLLMHPSYLDKIQELECKKDGIDELFNMPDCNLKYRNEGGVAIIDVSGTIGYQLANWQKLFGGCDCEDIQNAISKALEDKEIKGILLNIDSPGGYSTYVAELCDFIRDARAIKPIGCHTSTIACSAGYWIASACDFIYATKSADVGSISAYLAIMDISEYYKKLGVKVHVIKSGKLKGIGVGGSPLEDYQIKELERGVNYLHKMFTEFVKSNRSQIKDETMQGQSFYALESFEKDNGLVDSITDREQAIRDILTLSKMR